MRTRRAAYVDEERDRVQSAFVVTSRYRESRNPQLTSSSGPTSSQDLSHPSLIAGFQWTLDSKEHTSLLRVRY
jgi:hypothetical protein